MKIMGDSRIRPRKLQHTANQQAAFFFLDTEVLGSTIVLEGEQAVEAPAPLPSCALPSKRVGTKPCVLRTPL